MNDPQEKARSFCKALKYLCGEKNPDVKAQHYIDQLFKNELEEIVTQKEEVKKQHILGKHKASMVKVDGNPMGYFFI